MALLGMSQFPPTHHWAGPHCPQAPRGTWQELSTSRCRGLLLTSCCGYFFMPQSKAHHKCLIHQVLIFCTFQGSQW